MNDRSSTRWTGWFSVIVVLSIPALLAAAVVWGASGSDGDHRGGTAHAAVVSSQQVAVVPTSAVAEPSMAQQHQAMLDQMRVSVPQQMLDQMARNAMWRQMIVGEPRTMEEHEEGLDRMLAR